MKKILFAASEGNPFIKTGGLADVVGALPKYIDKSLYEVSIMMPLYQCIPERYRKKMKKVTHFYEDMPREQEYIGIYKMKESGITYYFIDNEYYFAGNAPYNQIYEDVNKFAFFSRAVLAALPQMDYCPDVIHCHDWQTGLLPLFLKVFYNENAFYSNIKTILTIHNQKFQGRWRIDDIENCRDIPEKYRYGAMEAYGESNFLKAGILYADQVTTVSETYAREIQTPEGGEGLEGVMREVSEKLLGITNGIDEEEYNPKIDKNIPYPFGVGNIAEKKKDKKALQKEMGLKQDSKACLIAIVSRLTQQKGFELVVSVMEELLQTEHVQVVVLGTGEERFQHDFSWFAQKYPDRVSANIGYSEDKAHRIYAGADMFLMPSQFEPCGLSQLISMRYGTVPIVRETGGLKDTVEPYNEIWQTGNGFGFRNYNAGEMLYIIRYALKIYQEQPKAWRAMMKRCMKRDSSWQSVTKKYENLYAKLTD
ncbi:glycogen synthase GlgA [Roseburia sp. 499]|uniref:glycogen synthase GlgA n=1 Tax=Roseburia sp. 499 TaxID=1261634 RepID=UPI0009524D7D|nr:glycogen synthase GlgA [Roseburia sp. 499]WVK68437.1 glycogen synthase GlgA [Roseburia sp. 499]